MHSRLRRPAVALITTTLAASVLGIAPTAHAVPGGTISGHLEHDGQAITDDVTVAAWQLEGADWVPAGEGHPDAQGDYTVDGLGAGDYRLTFESRFGTYVYEAYDDVADWDLAETLTLADGESLSGIDADLALAGDVEGTVEDASGEPISGAFVTLFTEEAAAGGGTEWTYSGYGTETDELGAYTVDRLPAGTYRVEFQAEGYQVEYFDDVAVVEDADDVVLAEGASVTDVDAQLVEDASISGVVTDVDDAPLAGVWVGAEIPGTDVLEYAQTDEAGKYTLDGLAAGSYVVSFDGYDEATDVSLFEYFDNVGDLEHATPVAVTTGDDEVGIDAQLIEGEHEPVMLPYLDVVTAPTITGAAQVGSTLTATSGTWTPAPTGVEYFWFAGDTYLHEGATYVPTAADLGKQLTVLVAVTKDGYERSYAESAATAPVAAAPAPAPAPVPAPAPTPTVDVPTALAALVATLDVAGKPKVGKTVKVKGLDKLLRSTGVSYKFKWFAGAKKIKKATKSKLKITKAMKGKKISVKVTARAGSASKTVKLKVGKVA